MDHQTVCLGLYPSPIAFASLTCLACLIISLLPQIRIRQSVSSQTELLGTGRKEDFDTLILPFPFAFGPTFTHLYTHIHILPFALPLAPFLLPFSFSFCFFVPFCCPLPPLPSILFWNILVVCSLLPLPLPHPPLGCPPCLHTRVPQLPSTGRGTDTPPPFTPRRCTFFLHARTGFLLHALPLPFAFMVRSPSPTSMPFWDILLRHPTETDLTYGARREPLILPGVIPGLSSAHLLPAMPGGWRPPHTCPCTAHSCLCVCHACTTPPHTCLLPACLLPPPPATHTTHLCGYSL